MITGKPRNIYPGFIMIGSFACVYPRFCVYPKFFYPLDVFIPSFSTLCMYFSKVFLSFACV